MKFFSTAEFWLGESTDISARNNVVLFMVCWRFLLGGGENKLVEGVSSNGRCSDDLRCFLFMHIPITVYRW